jgi:hypothetical protein
MRWIEMIRVRSSSDVLAKALPPIVAETNAIRNLPGLSDVVVLRHALFEGDLAVVLLWDNERSPVQTREGLLLADHLKRYGLTDHAVWMAAPGFDEKMHCDGCNG